MTFTEAYARYYPTVMKICRSFFTDGHTAEDATQEAFFRLMQKWDSLDEKDALDAWLRKTATNICIDILRKRKKEILFEEIHQIESLEEDPGKLLLEEAREIVAKFPGIYQEMFHLSFICGYTGQQIADRLRIPLSTVKTRTRVCLQRIQAAL